MASKVLSFINYTKEAFFTKAHLVALTNAGAVTVSAAFALDGLLGVNPLAPFMVLAGLEFIFLATITRNERFVRAINAKYADQIDAFNKRQRLAEYYNLISADSQVRFESLRKALTEISNGYIQLHGSSQSRGISALLNKVNEMQIAYVKLLYMQEKLQDYMSKENPQRIQQEIEEVRLKGLGADGQLKLLSNKRIQLLEKRRDAFYQASSKLEKIGIQLATVEDLASFLKQQPIALKDTMDESEMIDQILEESERISENIVDINTIINSDLNIDGFNFEGTETLNQDEKIVH